MVTATEALATYLAEPPADIAPEPERFRIESLEQANWAARILQREERAIREVAETARAEIGRIQEWRDDQVMDFDRRTSHLRTALQEWHKRRMDDALAEAGSWEAVKGPKSVKLIGATVKARRSPDSWEPTEPDAFVAWAEACGRGELVKVEKRPRIVEAKKALATKEDRVIDPATGEVVPGLTVHPGEINYDVEVMA